ncbi:cytospin-A-like [Biomphalaria glabrata]|uniref:Cytospin-A-like n=1 Tax=Biomphalaria glabrata TaxID=6526 RepID=A0A9U8EB48_BIOGL|nr:cytospin-A-like [Biomphalaria glabrata]XP_013080876.2 cytospin-A-like [Biomphalaria glabrata]XP_055862148.1 cytospin-A-like [Biomphalaria glabrata]
MTTMKKQEKGVKIVLATCGEPNLSSPSSQTPLSTTLIPGPTNVYPGDATSMGMKHSKSDHSGLGRKDKNKETKMPMGKKFISKSQDNLSGYKKGRQLTTVLESPRPRENAASLARAEAARALEKNKENTALREREKNVFIKPKPVKPTSMTNIRKASSTQSIDRNSQGSGSLRSTTSKSSHNISIKRAQSTQNISKDKFMKKRTSAPADVMAYNAELLANFEKEKKVLEGRISELTKIAESRKEEIEKYKYEIKRLKKPLAMAGSEREELEMLRHENKQLQDRLTELGFPAEQITDSQKLRLKFAQPRITKSHSSSSDIYIPVSTSCDSLSTDGSGAKIDSHTVGDGPKVLIVGTSDLRRSTSLSASEPGMSIPDLCGTPEHPSIISLDTANWDKQSNKSANSDGCLSEASVACLTERILQMEETNYSTTEELQATLQELSDLQDAVNELTEENTKLTDEKAVLLESLCTQTEKLENTRIQLEQLKCLLISGELPDKSEKDGHLLGLLKSAQEEREELMRKQMEWSNALQALENDCREAQDALENLREKYSFLEDANSYLRTERDSLIEQLTEVKEAKAAEHIELVRLRTVVDAQKAKLAELELSPSGAPVKTDTEALLDEARHDKEQAEQKLADVTENLALMECELIKLKDSLASKEQELSVIRSNIKTQVTDLQFALKTAEKEKVDTEREMETLRVHVEQLTQECLRHVEDKKSFTAKLQEVQSELRKVKQEKQLCEAELDEISSKHDMESEEWKQFQKDLQTAVVIANNFSQETQEKMDRLTMENSQLHEKCLQLEDELNKLTQEIKLLKSADEYSSKKSSILTNAELKGKVLTSMDRELAGLREGRPHMDQRSQNISVKSLIRSIEEQVKSGCSSIHSSRSDSRRSSTSSDISLTSYKELVKAPSSPLPTPDSPRSPTKDFALRSLSLRAKHPERSPQQRLSAGSAVCSMIPSPESSCKTVARGDMGDTNKTPQISSILKDRSTPRRGSTVVEGDATKKETPSRDPLASLAKLMKGSKRNALLKWCQLKTIPYSNVDITNFSSSWNDGLGFCALLHSYVPDKIPYFELTSEDKRKNFSLAFSAGENIGIKSTLNINEMVSMERPDWQAVMNYVTAIYKHFEVDRQ